MRRPLTAFLVAFIAINFADKAVFGLSAAQIMGELHLSNAQFGAVGGSFFALFSLSALAVGRLGDRSRAGPLLAGMAAAWTAAQALATVSASGAALVASRILLGAGEGPAFPSALHVSYAFVPERDRAKATGFILAGAPLGTSLAALLLTPLLLHFGWRFAYAVLAFVSFVWAACWLALASKAQPRSAAPKELRPSWRELLGNRKMIGAMLASFMCYFANAVAIVWYPKFFETGAGIGAGPTGVILAAAWASQIPVCIFAGWIIARGAEKQSARAALYGRIGIAALGLTSLSLIGLTFTSILPVIVASAVASLLAAATLFIALAPLVAELAPSGSRATALGAYAAFYALAGAIGPWLFGAMVDQAGSAPAGYRLAFTVLAGATIVVTLIAALLILPARRALVSRPERARA